MQTPLSRPPNADPPLGWADQAGCRPPRQNPGVWQTPPPRYGQQAGGTHPTGMHTCFENKTRMCSKFRGTALGWKFDVATVIKFEMPTFK